MSRSDPWQNKFTSICQEIRNITHQSKTRKKHISNLAVPKINYRDKTVSLDTHEGNVRGGVYSGYNRLLETESNRSSGNPEHYDTPIYDASPTPPSGSPTLAAPHTPLLIPGSWISVPSSDVGLGRACNTALSQSPSSCMNAPGESD